MTEQKTDSGNSGDHNKISLRSEEVGEILGKPPGWLISYGTGLLLMVMVIVIAGTGFFNYPDIVRAPVIITRENPPSILPARASGKFEALFFKDGTYVSQGDTIAVIENPARYIDIFRLGNYVSDFNRLIARGNIADANLPPGDLVLGDVQPGFNAFASSLNEYIIFMRLDYYDQRIIALQAELEEYRNYAGNLQRQQLIASRDAELAGVQFRRDSSLYIKGVISESEFENAQAILLARQRALETAGLGLSDAAITMARLERSIADTRLEKEERQQLLHNNLINSFRQMESALAAWENRYLIAAPVSGLLNYLTVWSSLQELQAGEPAFSVIPEDMGELHARILLPFRRAGKVKPGQRVNIKLDGYPYMEFGMVEGQVHSVSGGPVENGFPAVITLPGGAVTSFGTELEVMRELPGIAEISTDEMSLLERLFSPLRHLIKNRMIRH